MEFRKSLHNVNPATFREREISPAGVANYFSMSLSVLGGGLYLIKQRDAMGIPYVLVGAVSTATGFRMLMDD